VPGLLFSRPNWVPPLQESVAPLWIQGGRHTHFRMRGWGELIPTMGHTLWYSKYTINIIPRRPRLCNTMSPDPRPSHRSFADISGEQQTEKTAKNHSVGEYPAISMICRENPAKVPVWQKIRQSIPLLI
jgi:hypothetical protein